MSYQRLNTIRYPINRLLFLISILAFSFTLTSCDNKKLTEIPNDGIILAFGDSLTVGVGSELSKSYPSVLAQLSGRTVINAGVSGELTAQGLLRLPEVITQTNPHLLILLEGGNDILRNRDHQQIKKNLAAMIEYAQENQIDVVLVGVPNKNILLTVAPFYNELANEYSLVYAEELLSNLLRNPHLKSDAIHLNQKGYQVFAESIYEILRSRGAL